MMIVKIGEITKFKVKVIYENREMHVGLVCHKCIQKNELR